MTGRGWEVALCSPLWDTMLTERAIFFYIKSCKNLKKIKTYHCVTNNILETYILMLLVKMVNLEVNWI